MMKISDIMVRDVITLKNDDTLADALKLMNSKGINGAPVLDDAGKLSGMVVKADIYRFLTEPGRLDQYPVNLVMSKDVVTGSPEENILQISNKLLSNKVISLPIIENDKVIGIVSIEDLLYYFVNNSK